MRAYATNLILVLLLGSWTGGFAQESTPASGKTIESFQLIFQRNIFNPDRAAGRRDDLAPAAEEKTESIRPVETESLVLLGTISYDKGNFGFFDGSRTEFRKTVPTGDSIAGFRVAHINSRRVCLERDGQVLELPVGKQLSKREDEAEWNIVDRMESFPQDRTRAGSSGGEANSEDRPSAAPQVDSSEDAGDAAGDEAEILKLLMQKREQELSNEN